MPQDELQRRAIALYDRFTHGRVDRRAFMAELATLAGGAVAANALLAAIAADPAKAAMIAADDKRLTTRTLTWETRPGRKMSGYNAAPAGKTGLPVVIVIHENRGLNEHIRDVARRMALQGFSAVAPDFLTPVGGTPADENKAREMIGALDMPATLADGIAMVEWLATGPGGKRRIGVTGFCWGGAMSNRIAVGAGASLSAAAPWYGPAPDPKDAARIKAPMLLHYAENDPRVNQTAQPWIDALKAAKVPVDAHFYAGTEHAFHNDTSAARYNKAAADLAWARTVAFFKKHLARR